MIDLLHPGAKEVPLRLAIRGEGRRHGCGLPPCHDLPADTSPGVEPAGVKLPCDDADGSRQRGRPGDDMTGPTGHVIPPGAGHVPHLHHHRLLLLHPDHLSPDQVGGHGRPTRRIDVEDDGFDVRQLLGQPKHPGDGLIARELLPEERKRDGELSAFPEGDSPHQRDNADHLPGR